MSFSYRRHFSGPVRCLITDLAGTVVDYGSCAPAGAFVELFQRYQVEISTLEAREPMGLEKKDHIRTLTNMPRVAAKWNEVHGAACTEDEIEKMYQEFIPLQMDVLPQYSRLIPGVLGVQEELKKQGIRVGATTGYNREMMETVLKEASQQGFLPEEAVCASDVPSGRPAPWMIYRSLQEFDIYPPEAAVKIGDTVPDIEAGLNAGVWTIGVAKTGNMLGLTESEVASLPDDELRSRLKTASEKLRAAGSHFVIHSFADCLPVIQQINRRLAGFEKP